MREAIILGGNCPGVNGSVVNYPGGNCPRTLLEAAVHQCFSKHKTMFKIAAIKNFALF